MPRHNGEIDQGGNAGEDVVDGTILALRMAGKGTGEVGEILGMTRDRVRKRTIKAEEKGLIDEVRAEVQRQVLDPVRERLEAVALDAMEELWVMREQVESDKLRKDILVDVLHMAGYRPHTSVDKQSEDLPTIMIGQLNIGDGQELGPSGSPKVPINANMEITDAQEIRDSSTADGEQSPIKIGQLSEASKDEPGDESVSGRTSGEE